jgi:hypothetical protein
MRRVRMAAVRAVPDAVGTMIVDQAVRLPGASMASAKAIASHPTIRIFLAKYAHRTGCGI